MSVKPLVFNLLFAMFAMSLANCGGGDEEGRSLDRQDSGGTDAEVSFDDGLDDDSSGDGLSSFDGDKDCAFHATLSGRVDRNINWTAGCDPRVQSDGTMYLQFTDPGSEGGLVFLIAVRDIDKGQTGTDAAGEVSIGGSLADDSRIFYQAPIGDCPVEITSNMKETSGFTGANYVVKGRVLCNWPVVYILRAGEPIEFGDIEFETWAVWPE